MRQGEWVFTPSHPISPSPSHDSQLTTIIMKTLITLTIITAIILITPELLSAQPGLPDAPDQVPIDSGLAILAAAGGGYAIKKLRDKNKS